MKLTITGVVTDDPDDMIIRFKGDNGRNYRQRQATVDLILDQRVRREMRTLFEMAVTGNPNDIARLIGWTIELTVKPVSS
jgi:hypothetical protein